MAELRTANDADLAAIRVLLEEAGLPTSDLEATKPNFTLLREPGAIVAAGALQRFGSLALLRSVVVAPDRRGAGLGVMHRARAREGRECRAGPPAVSSYPNRSGILCASGLSRDRTKRSPAGCPGERGVSLAVSDLCDLHDESTVRFTVAHSVTDRPYNVLFLCTGNSARSILAEALINQWGRGKFRGLSAGSHPKGAVHPIALQLLQRMNLPTEGLRSKSWDEFAVPGAAPLDFVFTVCDNAAGEVCPYWPGQPMTAHWGVPDPAAVEGTDADKWVAFRETFRLLDNRIKIFTSLPLATLDRIKVQERLDAIGRTAAAKAGE